ncbi:MAG: fused MFS/spermidine synthase [Bacteroidia bacterium]|nr:fused MFS/spermidine synthase [Bacteroidia bacterium]
MKTFKTIAGQELEIAYENGIKVLNTKNANYSFGSLHSIFKELFKQINMKQINPDKTLLLGLGGGSIVKLLRQDLQLEGAVTAIEFDQGIIDAAIKHFGIGKFKNVGLICEDAFKYLQNTNTKYDVIIDDLYLDIAMPGDSQQSDYFKDVIHRLTKNGLFIKNCIFTSDDHKTQFNKSISEVFPDIKVISIGKMNNLYLCKCNVV